jgi:hypothetical protein
MKDLPYNTNQAMSMATYDLATFFPPPLGTAIAGRLYGSWFYQSGYPNPVIGRAKLRSGAMALIQCPCHPWTFPWIRT